MARARRLSSHSFADRSRRQDGLRPSPNRYATELRDNEWYARVVRAMTHHSFQTPDRSESALFSARGKCASARALPFHGMRRDVKESDAWPLMDTKRRTDKKTGVRSQRDSHDQLATASAGDLGPPVRHLLLCLGRGRSRARRCGPVPHQPTRITPEDIRPRCSRRMAVPRTRDLRLTTSGPAGLLRVRGRQRHSHPDQ